MASLRINAAIVMMSSLLVLAAGFAMSSLAPAEVGWRITVTLAVVALVASLVSVAQGRHVGRISGEVVATSYSLPYSRHDREQASPTGGDDDVVILDGGHPVIIVGGRPWRGMTLTDGSPRLVSRQPAILGQRDR